MSIFSNGTESAIQTILGALSGVSFAFFNPFRPFKSMKESWEQLKEEEQQNELEDARDYETKTGRKWRGYGRAIISSIEDSKRLEAVRKRLGDRFDFLSQSEKANIIRMSSTELADYLDAFEKKFPNNPHNSTAAGVPNDDELEKHRAYLKRKYDLKKIELEMETKFKDDALKLKTQLLDSILDRHARMIQRIQQDSTLSSDAREDALRATEQAFAHELDEFTRNFR